MSSACLMNFSRGASTCILFVAVLLMLPSVAAGSAYHGLSVNFQWNHIETSTDQTYNLYSPGFNYSIYLGEKIGFSGRIGMFFPIQLQQEGTYYLASDYYSTKYGFDSLIGAGLYLPISEPLRSILGAGVHVNWIKLSGEDYISFDSLTMGLGIDGIISYRLYKSLEIGGSLSTGCDFIDLVHKQNDLTYGFYFLVGLTLGVFLN